MRFITLTTALLFIACTDNAGQAIPKAGQAGSAQPKDHTHIDRGTIEKASVTKGPSTLPQGHPPVDGTATANPTIQPESQQIVGTVLSTIDTEQYTYIEIQIAKSTEPVWGAVLKTTLKKGDDVVLDVNVQMDGFHSKTLNRTFKKLHMGALATSK